MVDELSNESIICPQCSVKNLRSSKFCKECGTSLTEGGSSTNRKQVTPHRKDNPVESLKESGKEIMEGIGVSIDRATGHEVDKKSQGPKGDSTSSGDGLSINGMITEE